MTPEALIVHYADDLDAKLQMMVTILAEDRTDGHSTSSRNVLGQSVFRGG
jgi:3'-5' exoribonuclease